jgi:iron complex transport system ATP-binding protein
VRTARGTAPARHDVELALEVRGLSVELDRRPIVTSVDLEVPAGGWVCVIGPNGAGKTTLVHAVAGLVPHSGQVALDGRPIRGLGRRERARRIALVPQLPVLPDSVMVEQYVLLGRTPHLGLLGIDGPRDHDAVASALERLDLSWAAGRRLETLSGGELRRVVLARALAQEAPLLVLDEPTTGLDLGQQLRVLELVDELRRREGLTVLSTMHDLTLAGRFAHGFALLSGGRLVARGDRTDVLIPHVIAEHYGAAVRVIDDGDLGWAVLPLPSSDALSEPS